MHLKIARDFSTAPGPRLISEGRFSGQQFRESILAPRVKEAITKREKLTVDLDGTAGYGTSFLEESFGGLIRNDQLPLAVLEQTLVFVSDEEPDLIDEIREYMSDAQREGSG